MHQLNHQKHHSCQKKLVPASSYLYVHWIGAIYLQPELRLLLKKPVLTGPAILRVLFRLQREHTHLEVKMRTAQHRRLTSFDIAGIPATS